MRTSQILEDELEDTYGLKFNFIRVPEYERVNLLASLIHQLPVMCQAARIDPKDISLGGMEVDVGGRDVHYLGEYERDTGHLWLNERDPCVFAHEWFHALDTRMARYMGLEENCVSKAVKNGNRKAIEMMGDLHEVQPVADRCNKYDTENGHNRYTARIDEVCARTFERYVVVEARREQVDVPMLAYMQAHIEADDPNMLCSAVYPHDDEIDRMAEPELQLCRYAGVLTMEREKQDEREMNDLRELQDLVSDYKHADEFMKPFILNKFASKAESMVIGDEKPSDRTMNAVDHMFTSLGADMRDVRGFDRER